MEMNRGNQHSRIKLNGKLTPRQDLVLRLLAQGLKSKDVAARLKVSSRTVSSAIESIRLNLEARTLEQAVAIWAVADYIESMEEVDDED
jgi:DNA-binding NarL/FixJ family response regulator